MGMEGAAYDEVWGANGSTITHYQIPGAGTIPADSVWVYLAMTYSSADSLSAYINGQLVSQVATNGSPDGLASNMADFIIANAPWATSPSLETFGYLDEVRVWNVTLTVHPAPPCPMLQAWAIQAH
jgi:hypothetical protein